MDNILFFLALSLFFVILPGPDMALITKNTVVGGKSAGTKTTLGICLGLCVHTTLAALGLSAIIVKSALLFSIFKYIGAAYLLYLGCKAIIAMRHPQTFIEQDDDELKSHLQRTYFKQGLFTNLLNPKIALLFFTFFPPFMASDSKPFFSFLIMGSIYIVLTITWFIFYILLLQQISQFIKRPKTQQVIEGLTGGVLIVFAVKLLFEKSSEA